jgi:hypothetical protein
MIDSQKKFLRLIAIGYLVATATAMSGFFLFETLTEAADFPAAIATNRLRLALGVLLQLVNDGAVVMIGVLFYLILRNHAPLLAVTVLTTRALEAGILIIGKIGILLLTRISSDGSADPLLAKLALDIHWWSFVLGMLPLGVGGFFLCGYLYKSRQVPRLLSILGMLAYVFLFAKSVRDILGYPDDMLWFMPGALFEFLFPLWLLMKGFSASTYSNKEE